MIKAVLFDWFTTLSQFEPSREKLYCAAFAELGIVIPEEKAARAVLLADEYLYTENMKTPLMQRPVEVREEMYLCFPRLILEEAGIKTGTDVHILVREKVRKPFSGATYILYDDVIPTLKALQEKGYIMGLVTNFREDIDAYCDRLGITRYLAFALTSQKVGAPKPDPRIFQAALEKANVQAGEAVFVGDQYLIDIVGSRRVGIHPVFIDRCDLYPNVTDCPRIRTLPEVENHLK